MRVSFNIEARDLKAFDVSCEAILTKIGRNTRKATVEACRVISEESLAQVPRDTDTLAMSQFWEVTGYYKTGWEARIGYGGNGDPINPKTGRPASSYMVAVHEDLDALHIGGKAKFLEDPIKDFARENFPRTVMQYVNEALR
jgi:hypothetical protein